VIARRASIPPSRNPARFYVHLDPGGGFAVSADRLSRRDFLKRSGLALAAAGLGIGSSCAQQNQSGFSFLALNDTHYRDEECAEYFRGAFAWIREHAQYDFALVCGDLATAGKVEELQGMKAALELLGKPSYPVKGNHDASEGDRSWLQVFGPDRINYRFDHGGWTFLGLDTTDDGKSSNVAASQATIDWIKQALVEIPPERPLVALTHFPLGELVPMRLTNADDVLALFDGHNLKHVFSGHFHGLSDRKHNNVVLTTCRCLSFSRGNHDGSPQKGFYQCHVKGEELTYEFVEYKPEE
jgi:3',5'-cyclic AMP phosphodiesterase CpdA